MKAEFPSHDRRGRFFSGLLATAVVLAGTPILASATNFDLPASKSSFDCSSVAPGDTITLASGTRGPLTIKNCNGSSTRPIVIRNDADGSSPTVVQRSSGSAGGFVMECDDCIGVTIDGGTKWRGAPDGTTYGIKITMSAGGSPSSFLKFSGMSRYVTIRNVEIDGAWPRVANDGIGIQIKDQNIKKASYPSAWREYITIDENYLHNLEGEGMYIGANWPMGELPIRNLEVRNNRIEDIGWEGMQIKGAIGGASIHHNTLRRVGKRSDKGQLSGISLLDGNGKIYANWVEKPGDSGIKHYLQYLPKSYGDQSVEIYNNVVVDTGQVGVLGSYGVVSANQSGYARPLPKIYNNTIVRSKDSGVKVGGDAAGGLIRDNLITDAGGTAVTGPSNISKLNNFVGSTSQASFVAASSMNFKLQPSSPARNSGGSAFPSVDIDGVPRPQDGDSDRGAYEYRLAGSDDSRPNPPVIVSIQ